jgi:DNA-binding winged helix-turn-helix (wHTH) protein
MTASLDVPGPVARVCFGPYLLDRSDASLWRESERVALTPNAYALLALLVARAGRLVTKQEILRSVWPDTFVSEAAVKVYVAQLRRALADPASTPAFVQTESRRGYRFIADVKPAPLRASCEESASWSLFPILAAALRGDPTRALHAALEAADRAAADADHDGCAAHLESALAAARFLRADDERLQCELLIRIGEAAEYAGRSSRARATLLQAVSLARESGDAALFARAVLALGAGHQSALAVDAVVIEHLEEALMIEEERDPALEACLRARLAYALYREPQAAERRRALALDALERADALQNPGDVATILRYAVWARWGPDALERRLELAERLVAVAARAGSPAARLHAHGTRIHFALEAGATDTARSDLAAYLELARAARRPWFDWSALRFRIMLALFDGDHDAAEQRIAESTSRARSFEHPDILAVFYAQMVALRLQQDRAAEILPFLAESARTPLALPAWKCALCYAHAQVGEHDAARELLRELSARDFAALPRDHYWKGSMALLADACAALAERDVARALYRALLPFQDHCGSLYGIACFGALARPLGRLAHLLGERREARRHLAAAVRSHERMGALPWLARTLHDSAVAFPDDRERGAVLARARELAARIGLPRLAEACAALASSSARLEL